MNSTPLINEPNLSAVPKLASSWKDVVFIAEGHDLELQCKGQGVPKPEVTWFKDNAEIRPLAKQVKSGGKSDRQPIKMKKNRSKHGWRVITSPKYHISSEGTLTVAAVDGRQDGGLFACRLNNIAGSVMHEARVIVEGGCVLFFTKTCLLFVNYLLLFIVSIFFFRYNPLIYVFT